ncbi:MAG TPA: CehA/McbA family metallohydrolase [Kofleriaceae bacterium]|nr:CehA/McbA family metallohydrolase [Kofleriaceae bacterium]
MVAAALGAGCGGDDDGPQGPRPLVADPAVITGCAPGPVTGTRAKVVACADELIAGRLASGRVGDFVLENARVRVIVRAAGEGYYLHGSSGGGIVDAATVGGEDLVKEVTPVVDLTAAAFDELVITEAGDDGAAELVVRGPAAALDLVTAAVNRPVPPIIVEHHYRLAAGASEVELETHVFTQPGAEVTSHEVYDALFMGGRAPAWLLRRGFTEGQGAAEIIATGGTTTSYGLVYGDELPDPQLIAIGGIRIALGPSVTESSARRWFIIGDGTVASVTERGWQLRGVELGVVTGQAPAGADVVLSTATAPITTTRADASGRYRIAAPPGAYSVRCEGVGRMAGTDTPATLVAGGEVTAAVAPCATGTLAVSVRDDGNRPVPARVLIERTGSLEGGERIVYVGASGDLSVPVAPGTWRVSVSRGLEYDAFVGSAVEITDGQTTSLPVTLTRVLDTAGWIALDTHLHSELSTDSTVPVDDRLRAVAAEGVEVPVSTDHDIIVDYAPVIEEIGLGAWLTSLTGSETTSMVWGHVNAFPLTPDPARTGAGSPRWLGRAPGEIFAALHAGGERIVQINHPRQSSDNFFDAIDLDTSTLMAGRDPEDLGLPATANLDDLSFDAMEVANALADGDFEEVFADYLAMVTAGHSAAATGSSDSHDAGGFAGEARTYVYVGAGADDPSTITADLIVDAIRARHVTVGTGAFVTAGVVTASGVSLPGDTADVRGEASVVLRVRVQAPPWQPIARVKIYRGAQLVDERTIDTAETAAVRFSADLTLPLPAADTFYVVRADPMGSGDPVIEGAMPAFTNPLFVRVSP